MEKRVRTLEDGVKPKLSLNYRCVEEIPVKIKRLNQLATIPKYAKEGDAGFDFYSAECKQLRPFETKVFYTGLKIEIPDSYEIQIRPRSGLSLKTSLRVANSPGTIDSGYRGEIGIIMQNTNPSKTLTIDIGDRIAQGVLKRVPKAKFIDVEELSNTERGEGGFGHTGK
ncbi:MAG: dUTP diphosphatase [Candidatus Woesearchaeota archaeon]